MRTETTKLDYESASQEFAERMKVKRTRLNALIEDQAGDLFAARNASAAADSHVRTCKFNMEVVRANRRIALRKAEEGRKLTEGDLEAMIQVTPGYISAALAYEAALTQADLRDSALEAIQARGRMIQGLITLDRKLGGEFFE